jgi:hypothetical protein
MIRLKIKGERPLSRKYFRIGCSHLKTKSGKIRNAIASFL